MSMQVFERILLWTMAFIMFFTLFAALDLFVLSTEFVTVFVVSLILALVVVLLLGRVIVIQRGQA